MDREKRRSEEEEKELDRRIALIREKNQQIEQRTKEIEEDRVRNEEKSPKSSSQTPSTKSTTPDRNGNGQWSREWDKGKTPAETWRENVPSMDLKGRLAGSQSANNNSEANVKNGKKGGKSPHGGGGQKKEVVKVPSRLEGRITFPKQEENQNQNQTRKGARGKTEHKTKEHKEHESSEIKKTQPADGEAALPAHRGQRRRGGQKKEKEHEKEKVQQTTAEAAVAAKKGKSRGRRESDNYAVRKVVHRLVEKVCWMERLEKRRAMRELLGEPAEQVEEEPPKSEDEAEIQETVTPPPSETSPEEGAALESPETPESAEEVKEDSNQNVINLVREKVVTMTTSQVA